jgi:hypothetical protein
LGRHGILSEAGNSIAADSPYRPQSDFFWKRRRTAPAAILNSHMNITIKIFQPPPKQGSAYGTYLHVAQAGQAFFNEANKFDL